MDKINERKVIKENLKKDINYVHNLNNWEKTNFPKSKVEPVIQSSSNPINPQSQ